MFNAKRAPRTSGEWRPRPFWQQRGWIASAGFLLAVLALGVLAVFAGNGAEVPGSASGSGPGSGSSDPSGQRQAEETPAGKPVPLRPPGCHTDDSDQNPPTAPPADVIWRNVGSTRVPTSEAAGPRSVEGRIWSCYARTPTGAVMAAHGIASQLGYPGWREVAERQLLPGKNRDAYVGEREKEKDASLDEGPGKGRYAGFTVLSYSEDKATVMLLMEFDGSGHLSSSVSLAWEDGDWRLVPEEDGSLTSPFARVSGTGGFVRWEE
ncbi:MULTISPECIES: hypothetical protein [Streptomyces]|uniref:DUF8175 domain-containing protein n=1 Tax=Streptomyces lycii TaxID=2654337 RepID=A0ABQ7FR38_9ACTN|nr:MULTISPECIES: hypothetical protein [Streptomyces]KAF4410149.1 hypothetical protein GCU69_05405 [Streptomyces lycii]PGH46842.1 hypothetical protein CRI70_31790 [Streptomyces sp. Ru87]